MELFLLTNILHHCINVSVSKLKRIKTRSSLLQNYAVHPMHYYDHDWIVLKYFFCKSAISMYMEMKRIFVATVVYNYKCTPQERKLEVIKTICE